MKLDLEGPRHRFGLGLVLLVTGLAFPFLPLRAQDTAGLEGRVLGEGGAVTRSEIALEVSSLVLEGILVEGQVGQAEALNRQRTAPSIRT